MKKISLLVFIFSLFLLVGVLGGCLPQGDKKEEVVLEEKTADWKEYQNQERKLSFKHPLDWQFSLINDTPQMFGAELKKEDESQEKIVVYTEEMVPYYSINISIVNNPKGLTAREHRLSQFGASSRAREEANLVDVRVGGQEGVRYSEGAAPSSGSSIMVAVAYSGKIYRFTYSALATEETHQKFLEVFDQLINTVKFL